MLYWFTLALIAAFVLFVFYLTLGILGAMVGWLVSLLPEGRTRTFVYRHILH